MTFRTAFLAVSLVGALASGASAASITLGAVQLELSSNAWQRTTFLPAAIRGKGCTFYEHAGGRGESWKKDVAWLAQSYSGQDSYAQYVANVGPWWNDKISSIKCDDSNKVHCSVAVYRDNDKGGGEAIFGGTQGLIELDRYGWNDTVSSFVVFCNLMK